MAVTDARNNTTSHTYDSTDRVQIRTDPVNAAEHFEYDGLGDLTRHTDRKGQVATFSCDPGDRRVGASYGDGSATTLSYDAGGRLIRASEGVGGELLNGYDAASRVWTITQAPLGPVTLDYEPLGRHTRLSLSNGVSTEHHHDRASRVTALIHLNATSVLGDLTYQYDAGGNQTGVGGSFVRTLLPNAVTAARR